MPPQSRLNSGMNAILDTLNISTLWVIQNLQLNILSFPIRLKMQLRYSRKEVILKMENSSMC